MDNSEDSITLKASILILFIGIGIFIQFLENYKIDDEPARSFYVPTSSFTPTSYTGTVSISTTTI